MQTISSTKNHEEIFGQRWRTGPADTKSTAPGAGSFCLRLARDGEWVRIVSFQGGRGFINRLAGTGLRVGSAVQVLNNPMNGKLVFSHEGGRFFLGGGMAGKIQVVGIEGGDK